MYFLLVGKSSESIGLALLVLFIALQVGVELFIVSVCKSLVENVLCVGYGNDCIEFWFGRGLL